MQWAWATFGQKWEGAGYEVFVRDIVGHYSYHLGHNVVTNTVVLTKYILDTHNHTNQRTNISSLKFTGIILVSEDIL